MRNGRKSLRMYVFFRGATRMYHKWIEMHWILPKWSKQGEWEKEKWHCDTNVEKQRGIHRNGGNLGKLSLKITEKVSFNIASEASYIYNLTTGDDFDWTKVHYKWQKWSIWATWSLRSNSVTRQVNFNRTKIGRKCQNATFWVIFKLFSTRFWFMDGLL